MPNVKVSERLISLRKHIALLLLGMFIFPIAYQSVHVVWYHPHSFICEHNHCQQTTAEKNTHTNGHKVSDEKSKCPICAYQFLKNEMPQRFLFNSTLPAIACNYIPIGKQQPYKEVFSDKTPRAPPFPFV